MKIITGLILLNFSILPAFAHLPKLDLKCVRINCNDIEAPLDTDTWCSSKKNLDLHMKGHKVYRSSGFVKKSAFINSGGHCNGEFYEGDEFFDITVDESKAKDLLMRKISSLKITIKNGVDWPEKSIRYISTYECRL